MAVVSGPAGTTQPDPPRPPSEAVAAALVRVADGEPALLHRPWQEGRGLLWLDTLSRWRLAIWWMGEALGPLHWAADPAGLQWVHGCARWPGWDAGPDAVALDPIAHLLTAEQRARLQAVVMALPCWPEPEQPPPRPHPPLSELFSPDDLDLIPS